MVDEKGFVVEMEKQKKRSRSAAEQERGDWVIINEEAGVEFVGYDELESPTSILKYREIKDQKGDQYQLVLAKTPFYAESGGQVGDQGILISGHETIRVVDTKKENDLIVHLVEKLPEFPKAVFQAKVDALKRRSIMNNHTATHLLQAALIEVLGDHIQQKGSLVNDQLLRFDFSHFAKLTDKEISEVEALVNSQIMKNIALEEIRNMPIEEAKKLGATALFGEKYGEFVRVIAFDKQFSIELCGGTHVNSTGMIGLFKIISEGSISSGVRRIEAITGNKALQFINGQLSIIKEIQDLLKYPKDLKKSIEGLVQDKQELKRELEGVYIKQAVALKHELLNNVKNIQGVNLIISQVKLPTADSLKKLAFELKNETNSLIAVLAAEIEGKPQIAVIIDEELVQSKNLNASQIVRELAKSIQGGGGGQPFFATAGGKKSEGLQQVVDDARKMFSSF